MEENRRLMKEKEKNKKLQVRDDEAMYLDNDE